MVKLFDVFKKGGDEANKIISRFNEERSKKRVEIENTPYVFYTQPLLHSGAVRIATPNRLEKLVSKGQWLRIRVPGAGRKDLRLQIGSIEHGHMGPKGAGLGLFSILCKIPGASVEPSKRASDRFTTVQFKDLVFEIFAPVSGAFQVMDLSLQGLRIQVADPSIIQNLPIGEYFSRGRILLGSKAKVEIKDFIPRAHFADSVGLEIVIDTSSHSRRMFDAFLHSLETKAGGMPPSSKAS